MALTMKQTEELFALYMNFGERVRKLLVEKNISPAVLADRMEVPRSSIYRFMSLGGHPDMYNLIKMANAFGISLDELVGLKD